MSGKIVSTSQSRGGVVPSDRHAAVPKATARRRHSEALAPIAVMERNPAIELSPAPTVDFAWIFGGSAAILSRIIYVVIALAGVWCISLLFRERESEDTVGELQ